MEIEEIDRKISLLCRQIGNLRKKKRSISKKPFIDDKKRKSEIWEKKIKQKRQELKELKRERSREFIKSI